MVFFRNTNLVKIKLNIRLFDDPILLTDKTFQIFKAVEKTSTKGENFNENSYCIVG